MELTTLGILILILPLASACIAGAFGPSVLKDRTHWPVILGVAGAAIFSFILFGIIKCQGSGSPEHNVYEWISNGAGWFRVNFWIDPLTAVMLTTVTFIATLIIIYSRDYMRHNNHAEKGYERFFAFMALFVFSMCALVIGGNFLLLYLGWEAVGLCSYLLIGFYYPKPSAAAAAKKAFLVNRIGDFGFGLGILLIYLKCGNLNYSHVLSDVGIAQLGDSAWIVALLLFCGAVGKSAQLPLYVWLPDAMEGPSPVSALIHAATMVTAGVYMVARCGLIFVQNEHVMLVVAIVGGATALFAATIAIAQYDMKRILAYSTISQLGYMFLGLGVYAADAAVFHLFTHAFFKALLFLGAGSVMHAMGGIIDVRKFGGLRKVVPVTFLTFIIGSAALAGFPFLSGFYSKDMIIHHALEVHPVLGIIGVITAALTAFYTFRMVFLAFFGEKKIPAGVHAHESGTWMLIPLCVLSAGAIVCGFLFEHSLPEFLAVVVSPFKHGLSSLHHGHMSHVVVSVASGIIAVGGILVAAVMYIWSPGIPEKIKSSAWPVFKLLNNKYYVDELYDAIIVSPLKNLGKALYAFDQYVIDGLVWLVTAIPRFIGFMMRSYQQGSLQGYGVMMVTVLGILLLVVVFCSKVMAY